MRGPRWKVGDIVWVLRAGEDIYQTRVCQVRVYPAMVCEDWEVGLHIDRRVEWVRDDEIYKSLDDLRKANNFPPIPKHVDKATTPKPQFKAPTQHEWLDYAEKIGFPLSEALNALDYYRSVGWKVGNKPMKDWEAAMRTCHSRWKKENPETVRPGGGYV